VKDIHPHNTARHDSKNLGQPTDIVILSNGPGEITTWVRPVVKALRQQLGNDRRQIRISLILSPCPNATGREVAIARTYPEIDRIQAAKHFFPFLLWGKTADRWDWRDRGVVLFLGGDQFYTVIIGRRMGYRTVIYGEWETRWHRWVDCFGVMQPALIDRASPRYRSKLTVVGDLMADVEGREQVSGGGCLSGVEPQERGEKQEGRGEGNAEGRESGSAGAQERERISSSPHPSSSILHPSSCLIGLLPGSKPAKLSQGVPLTLAIAQCLHAMLPQTQFVIPVAPTLDLKTLARFADPQRNPVAKQFGDVSAVLMEDSGQFFFKTAEGLRVNLWGTFPAHDLLLQCRLCLTTIGANTAELAALGVPMIVLLPTQQMDAMRSWDGLPGLLANLPGLGSLFAIVINTWLKWLYMRQSRLLAWPNIWAGEMIVPELLGKLQPQQVADFALDLLTHPEKLEQMRDRLRQVRGKPGAAQKLASLIRDLI
jgi:lipid-A-disaccharide synthase